jgi:CRP/FNR family cyclic AMP-dependent transcriptional regulator
VKRREAVTDSPLRYDSATLVWKRSVRASGSELARISLFQKLAPAELSRLEPIASRETFAADTVIFFEGDTSDSMYGIVSGSVKVYRASDDGEERIVDILGAGDVFGEYALIDGQPRSAAVATLEPTTVLSISHRAFRGFVSGAPEVLWKVLESFTERMRRQTREMMDFSRQPLPLRLVNVILKLAERHGQPAGRGRMIPLALSVASLAEMVASTDDRVARLLNRLETEGLIQFGRGELTIVNTDALRRSREYVKETMW